MANNAGEDMIPNERIEPHKVTKPIQLLAAWFVGLIVVDGCFLLSAIKIEEGNWERSALILAAIVNVPIFLAALFFLQTKFRPELQEDIYYSQYLDKRTDKVIKLTKQEVQDARLLDLKSDISKLNQLLEISKSSDVRIEGKSIGWGKWEVAINDHLEEFVEIRSELRKHKIPVKSIFGKIDGTDKPKKKIISFNLAMDFKSILALLRILSNFNFDGYMYSNQEEPCDPEDIYIGSYGFEKEKIIPFSEELKKILNDDIEEIDLKYFEKANTKKRLTIQRSDS
ncbi:MAG: hypothetical protein V2A69_01940 [Pseudomonadota bacterium]